MELLEGPRPVIGLGRGPDGQLPRKIKQVERRGQQQQQADGSGCARPKEDRAQRPYPEQQVRQGASQVYRGTRAGALHKDGKHGFQAAA